MDRENLISKEKEENENRKKEEEESKARREKQEQENNGIVSKVIIKDGGDIYCDIVNNIIAKRIIIDLKSESYHLEFKLDVD
jgi:hypothetical protein